MELSSLWVFFASLFFLKRVCVCKLLFIFVALATQSHFLCTTQKAALKLYYIISHINVSICDVFSDIFWYIWMSYRKTRNEFCAILKHTLILDRFFKHYLQMGRFLYTETNKGITIGIIDGYYRVNVKKPSSGNIINMHCSVFISFYRVFFSDCFINIFFGRWIKKIG